MVVGSGSESRVVYTAGQVLRRLVEKGQEDEKKDKGPEEDERTAKL